MDYLLFFQTSSFHLKTAKVYIRLGSVFEQIVSPSKHLLRCTQDTHLGFSYCKDQLLHTLLPSSRLPLLACDHHEIFPTTTKGNHRLVGVRDQGVLRNEGVTSVRFAEEPIETGSAFRFEY